MKLRLLAGIVLALPGLTSVTASAPARAPTHSPLDLLWPVQDKNFYVVSLLERSAPVAKAIETDASLAGIRDRKRAALRQAATACKTVSCVDEGLRWTDAEITAIADALKKLYSRAAPVRALVDGALRESGAYVRHDALTGADLIAVAWADAARGMNLAIDVYAEGKPSRYSAMDPPAFDVKGEEYESIVHTVTSLLAEEAGDAGQAGAAGAAGDMTLFFQPTLRYALKVLEINKRDEAGRLEPLDRKENAPAVKRIRGIDWTRFPYTVIVVPGAGADEITWPLTSVGKLRVEMAARRWRKGLAPLILVSGGYVHPNHTPFSEAVEMKRSLIADFGVPENAILIDPHARHTTTNLRNAAREMYRYGVPFERPALITTDTYQSSAIEGEGFAKRCEEELGYRPYRIVQRISVFDLVWTPAVESLQIDPAGDLLDP